LETNGETESTTVKSQDKAISAYPCRYKIIKLWRNKLTVTAGYVTIWRNSWSPNPRMPHSGEKWVLN